MTASQFETELDAYSDHLAVVLGRRSDLLTPDAATHVEAINSIVGVQAVAQGAIQQGFPVAINRANGKLWLADAGIFVRAFAAGMAYEDTADGYVCKAVRGRFHLADWTAVTGSPALTVGLPYFLAVGGGITASPNLAAGHAAYLGYALDANSLFFDPINPIQV